MPDFKAAIWNNRVYLLLTSAILLSLSFPPLPFPFLEIPGFILLLRLAALCENRRETAYWSYGAFVLWNLAVTYWLMFATLAGGVAAILANSVLMTIPLVVMKSIQEHLKNRWVIAALQAATWTSYEFLHHHWDLAWPWLALGNAWSMLPEFIQYISITGVLGISFWIVFSSSLIFQFLKKPQQKFLPISFALLLPPLFSLALLLGYQEHPTRMANVVVGQPNFNSYQTLGGFKTKEEALENLLSISDSLMSDSIDAVFWPENAIRPAMYEHEKDYYSPLLRAKSKQWESAIITGTTYYDFFSTQEAPSLVRTHKGQKYIYYNASVGFFPDGEKEVYYKGKLVPIVERIPFLNFLHKYNILNLNFTSMGWLGKGRARTRFNYQDLRVPALVCYDSVFPGWVRGFVRDDANLIAIITNDGWWGRTSGHLQHFHYARLRAIETRRWIVRSANNGISGIISSTGAIKKYTSYKTRTAFVYNVPLLNKKTLYIQWGDWLPVMCLISLGFYLSIQIYRWIITMFKKT